MNIYQKLASIQQELKAPKNLYNSFGKYKYRNAESIYESLKPMLSKYNVTVMMSDSIDRVGDRYYIKASATIVDCDDPTGIVQVSALARESLDKKGMDDSQISGTASSYARKYALNGLFLLDDTKDADTDEYHNETSARASGTHQNASDAELSRKMVENGKKSKISESHAAVLRGLIQKIGMTEEAFCQKERVEKLTDMNMERFMVWKDYGEKNKLF